MTVIVHKEKSKDSYCTDYFGYEKDVVEKAFAVLGCA
jgi:hypothetical protein